MVMVLLTVIPVFSTVTYAAENKVVGIDKSNVMDDLKSCEINGKPFDVKDFPFDNTKDLQVLSFVEYCYTTKAGKEDNYSLYLYVYNPKGLDISLYEKENSVQMAISYDNEGKPVDYAKFSLKFVSKVESGDYKGLFYKFKVVDRKISGQTFIDRVNSNARRYDISGIELTTVGSDNPTEYTVGGTYIFTGYAKGYGPDENAESTLDCKVEYLETVHLDVKHTFYRTETSALGKGHQNQLNTVYFSVSKRLINEYGSLQRIKAEWYEYKTKEIVVTSNSDFYSAAYSYLGKVPTGPDSFGCYDRFDTKFGLVLDPADGGGQRMARWGWNLGSEFLHTKACPTIYYLFKTDRIESYDPLENKGGINSNQLYSWIKSYNKSYNSGRLPIKNGSISADLFEKDIDESRKVDNEFGKIQMGYSYYDFDADVDLQILKSWTDTSPSFWDNWKNFGFSSALSGGPTEESRELAPIIILKASDLTGTNAEIADRLCINVNDVESLRKTYNTAKSNSEEVVLFRFATSDYYSEFVDVFEKDGGFLWADKIYEDEAYIAKESVFLDFDIIQLTFHKEGKYTVIPAVSNPIDIVNDITTPVHNEPELEWWKIVLIAVGVVILLIFFFPLIIKVLGYIVYFTLRLLFLPLELIVLLIKKIRERKE